MRILVTGVSGLLGINLALEAAKTHEVYGVAADTVRPNEPEAFEYLQADLLKPGALEAVLDETQPDWVIHCAALAVVDACEADPNWARQLNTELPARLARMLSEHVARGGARLVHISTDAVFDGRISAPGSYIETDMPNPLSTYARTKLEAEQAVQAECPQALVPRINMVGWSLSGRRALSEFFYYRLQAGERVNGYTDVFFCPLLANDLARLLLEMLDKNLQGIYHVVSRDSASKYDFAVRLARQFGLDEALITPVSVSEGGLAAQRSPRLVLSTEKLRQALGRPTPSVEEGIEGLYRLYKAGYPERLRRLAG
jgi:dTDP-4-dehydrorhamnose reductase